MVKIFKVLRLLWLSRSFQATFGTEIPVIKAQQPRHPCVAMNISSGWFMGSLVHALPPARLMEHTCVCRLPVCWLVGKFSHVVCCRTSPPRSCCHGGTGAWWRSAPLIHPARKAQTSHLRQTTSTGTQSVVTPLSVLLYILNGFFLDRKLGLGGANMRQCKTGMLGKQDGSLAGLIATLCWHLASPCSHDNMCLHGQGKDNTRPLFYGELSGSHLLCHALKQVL